MLLIDINVTKKIFLKYAVLPSKVQSVYYYYGIKDFIIQLQVTWKCVEMTVGWEDMGPSHPGHLLISAAGPPGQLVCKELTRGSWQGYCTIQYYNEDLVHMRTLAISQT